jgi:hypothetical protein
MAAALVVGTAAMLFPPATPKIRRDARTTSMAQADLRWGIVLDRARTAITSDGRESTQLLTLAELKGQCVEPCHEARSWCAHERAASSICGLLGDDEFPRPFTVTFLHDADKTLLGVAIVHLPDPSTWENELRMNWRTWDAQFGDALRCSNYAGKGTEALKMLSDRGLSFDIEWMCTAGSSHAYGDTDRVSGTGRRIVDELSAFIAERYVTAVSEELTFSNNLSPSDATALAEALSALCHYRFVMDGNSKNFWLSPSMQFERTEEYYIIARRVYTPARSPRVGQG